MAVWLMSSSWLQYDVACGEEHVLHSHHHGGVEDVGRPYQRHVIDWGKPYAAGIVGREVVGVGVVLVAVR